MCESERFCAKVNELNTLFRWEGGDEGSVGI